MKITDLIIDPRSLGSKLWLVEVSPAYEYRENRKTDTVLGYRYTVAMPEKGLDKINVRIDGDKRMDAPDGYAEVRFDGLEVFIYWSLGRPAGEKTIPLKGSVPRRQRQRRLSHKGAVLPLWQICSK